MANYDDDKTRIGNGANNNLGANGSQIPPWMNAGNQSPPPQEELPKSWEPPGHAEPAPQSLNENVSTPEAQPAWMPTGNGQNSQSEAQVHHHTPSTPEEHPVWMPPNVSGNQVSPSHTQAAPSWSPQQPLTDHQAGSFAPPPGPQYGSQGINRAAPVSESRMLFVVDGVGAGREYPLTSGCPVTVGRESTQDIVINDKTLSRKHLILQRQGERVIVQIIGLNGLFLNEALLKSQIVNLEAPTSFSVGKIPCRIIKEVDADATIMMPTPTPQLNKGGLSGAGNPAVNDFTPNYSPGPVARTNSVSCPPNSTPPHAQSQDNNWSSPPSRKTSAPSSFDPSDYSDDDLNDDNPFQPVDTSQSGISKIWIGGIAAAVVLIGIILFFTLLNPFSGEAPVATTKESSPEITLPKPDSPQVHPNDLYGKLFAEAEREYNEGRFETACDYLKDLRYSGEFQQRATLLAAKIEGCSL